PFWSARLASRHALAVFGPVAAGAGAALVVLDGAGCAATPPARHCVTYAFSVIPLAWFASLLARHSSWQALTVFCCASAGKDRTETPITAQPIAMMVRMSATPGLTPLQGLGLLRAFLHEAVFRRSRESLSILADGLGRANVHLPFFYEGGFGGGGEGFGWVADRPGLAGLSHRAPDGKRGNQNGK